MFEIIEEFKFSASHKMNHADGTSSNIHGHEWHLKVFAQTPKLNEVGMSRHYLNLRNLIQEELNQFDHKYLNDLQIFKGENPTAEIISMELFNILSQKANTDQFRICAIELWEAERRKIRYFKNVWDKI